MWEVTVLAAALVLAGYLGWWASRRWPAPKGPGVFQPGGTPNAEIPELLANVSHEIRTPLNGILGLTQLLLETKPTSQQREYLEMIKSSGGTLLRAMNDILDYSRVHAGKLRLESEAFHVRRWVRQCVKTLAPQAHEKGIELAYWIEPSVPGIVASDAARLRQVLVNLAVNAIKYTREGEVVIDVDATRAENGSTRLIFSVSDTGVGIPSSMHRQIFEAFTQAEEASSGDSGLGLGLAISSRILERMGGSIRVESKPERGSVFRFEVPVQCIEGVDDEAGREGALRGLRALLIDDSEVQRRVLGRLLSYWGVEVTFAKDAESARAAIASEETFSFMLLDSRIPGVDILAFAEQIQRRTTIAGVLMTMAHEHTDPDALREHGILGQLTKPIAPSHLLRAIEIIRRGATVEKPSDVQTYTMDRLVLGGLRLLVAEDDPVNRTVLVHGLELHGCEVVVAENGRDALRLASDESFDALLLDVEMPELDGLSVCRELRKREVASSGRHLAIVATTAHAREEDRQRCLAAGMDAFVPKPFDEAQLVSAIEGALRRGSRPGVHVFDSEAALARATGDASLLKELIELFLAEYANTLGLISSELDRGGFANVERLAHRLKGALLTLAAKRTARAVVELETGAKSHAEAACRASLTQVRVELDTLVPVLRANLVSRDDASIPSKSGVLSGSEPSLSDRRPG